MAKQPVGQIVKELQEYERQRLLTERCGIVSIENRMVSKGCHAAAISHVCVREAAHTEQCQCWCKKMWKGKK